MRISNRLSKVYHASASQLAESRQILSCKPVFGQVDVWQVVYCWSDLLAAQELDMSVGEKVVGTAVPRPKAAIAGKFFVIAQPFSTNCLLNWVSNCCFALRNRRQVPKCQHNRLPVSTTAVAQCVGEAVDLVCRVEERRRVGVGGSLPNLDCPFIRWAKQNIAMLNGQRLAVTRRQTSHLPPGR